MSDMGPVALLVPKPNMDPESSCLSSKGFENSLVSNMVPGNSLLSKIYPGVSLLSTKVNENSSVSTKASTSSILSTNSLRNSLVPYSLDSESEEDDSSAEKELSVAPDGGVAHSANYFVAENLSYEFIARPANSKDFASPASIKSDKLPAIKSADLSLNHFVGAKKDSVAANPKYEFITSPANSKDILLSSLIKSDKQPAINDGVINIYPYQSLNHSDRVKTEDLASFRNETPVDKESTDTDAVKRKDRTVKSKRGRPKKKAKENIPDDIIKMQPLTTEFSTHDFIEAFGSSMTVGDASDAINQLATPERREDIIKPEANDSNVVKADIEPPVGHKSVIVLLDEVPDAQCSPKSSSDEKPSSKNVNINQSSSAGSVKIEEASLDFPCAEVVETSSCPVFIETSGSEHCAFTENLTGEPICDETEPGQQSPAKDELIPGSGSFKLIPCDAGSLQTSSILPNKDEVTTVPSVEKKKRFHLNIPKLSSRMPQALPQMGHDYMDGELQNVQGCKVHETA